jgi:hypothetical protein
MSDSAASSPSPQPSPLGREFLEAETSRVEPLKQKGGTSNIQHPTSNVQGLRIGPPLDVGSSMLDVGCSPGSWRGSVALHPSQTSNASESPTDCRQFSLSPRERAGVRGKPVPARLSLPHPFTAATMTVLGVLASASVLVLFFFDPRQYHFYPFCFFHQTTGLLCPGCGALRAGHQLLHGHLATAFHFNPMLVVSLPFLVWWAAYYGLQRFRNKPASLGLRPKWLWLILAGVLVVSVLRNLPGTPFSLMRP